MAHQRSNPSIVVLQGLGDGGRSDSQFFMDLLSLINPECVSEDEVKNFRNRDAARAIVLDENGKIGMLHVIKEDYYKLPGGGIEGSEDAVMALHRECLEEIGCAIEIIGEVGMIVEYRKFEQLKQISYCFITKVKGEKGNSHFTDEETEKGFQQIWLSYEQASRVLSKNTTDSTEGNLYIVPRDFAFLRAAQQLI